MVDWWMGVVAGEMVGGPKNMVADVNHGNHVIYLVGRCMEKIRLV